MASGKKPRMTRPRKPPAARGTPAPRLPRDLVKTLLAGLHGEYPAADCALSHRTPLELLVATILSAQCTDERVNRVTRELFQRYRTPRDYADAPPGQLENDIRSTGFFNNKARSLRGMGRVLLADFNGEIPRTMEELLTLPGVARKTANVVLGTAYGIASGITVDTHVLRLSHRLGLSAAPAADRVEQDLLTLIPRNEWIFFGHAMIQHGRRVCQARKPKCAACVFGPICPSRE